MGNRVVIIGSGLGGLECGYILAKQGYEVTVLEQSRHIGGCLQTYVRGHALFDTGFHYVGGLGEGEPLNVLFRYFGLTDLPWVRLDNECFDEVVVGEESFPIAAGHGRFVERLSERFPRQKDALRDYASFLKNVGEHIFDSLKGGAAEDFFSSSLFSRSAYGFLCEKISDPLLRTVLSGTSLKMELDAEALPLYVFAQINNSFICSSWRLRGGGSLIADALERSIQRMGGRVRTDAGVTALRGRDGRITEVEVNGAELIEADWVISDIHPAATVDLVDEEVGLRKVYRRRVGSLRNTFGMFSANVRLKEGVVPYLNRNIFVHRAGADLWHPVSGRTDSVLVNFPVPYDGSDCVKSVDLLTPMVWDEVSRWADLPFGRRGEDYVEFKKNKTQECIDLVSKRLPELAGAVDRVYTSTPITYYTYLKDPQGTAYGVAKDWRSPMTTVLAPRTPVGNLLLTGQSLNLHGILGVSMTSLFTCGEILGLPTVLGELGIG